MTTLPFYNVRRSSLKGTISCPSSKSQTLRALLFGSLAKGKSHIYTPLSSPDTEAMVKACRLFGASINIFLNYIEIEGVNGTISSSFKSIDAGNSGIVLRFCSAIGALGSAPFTVTGDHSIQTQRSVMPLLLGLKQLKVKTSCLKNDGYAPIEIQGPLCGGVATIEGADSQPVSALLIAGAFCGAPIQLNAQNAGEIPWVALTLEWFDRLGIPYQNNAYSSYELTGNAQIEGFTYHVPGDCSSAAFPLAAALITGSALTLTNIDLNDPQGDKELFYILQRMGASIKIDEKEKKIDVKEGSILSGIRVDLNSCIDALPILAVVACFAKGETHIYNAAVARGKESDRLSCMTKELKKMGADIVETSDGLIIKNSILHGTLVHSHEDHRIAMALAVAGMAASGETVISSVACVAKTFSTFVDDFRALGANIEVSV